MSVPPNWPTPPQGGFAAPAAPAGPNFMTPPQGSFAAPQPGGYPAPPPAAPGGYPAPAAGYPVPNQGFPGAAPQQQPRIAPTPLDPNDQFLGSAINFDPDIDPNVSMPPVVPTEWLFGNLTTGYTVIPTFANPAQPWQKAVSKGVPYIFADMVLIITDCSKDPTMNGRRIKFKASTLVSQYSPTSSAQRLIYAVTGGAAKLKTMPRTPFSLKQLIDGIVQSAMRCRVNTDWEASLKAGDGDDAPVIKRVKGWRSFPLDQTGRPVPQAAENFPQYGLLQANAYNQVSFISADQPQATAANTFQPAAPPPTINMAAAPSGYAAPPPVPQVGQPVAGYPQPQQPQQQPQQPQQPQQGGVAVAPAAGFDFGTPPAWS